MAQVTTKTTAVETHETDEDEETATPLFDRNRNAKSKTITRVSIRRSDPPEGHLGYLPADATEQDIAQKYGGGEFVIQAKNDSGQIVQTQSLKIAGDPIFQSDIEEARWRRLNRLPPSERAGGAGGGTKEMITLFQETEQRRRDQEREDRARERQEGLDRDERARREAREHDEKLQRERIEADERRRKDEAERDDKRRRDQAEADERRTRAHKEDLERQAANNAAQLAQTQQFFQQLTAMMKADAKTADQSDPVKLLTTGMELAMKMREGAEPGDALTAIFSRLPETLAEVRSTAKDVYSEVTGKNKNKAKAAAAAPGRTVATGAGDQVTITGDTAKTMKQMIETLRRAGKDPEEVLKGLSLYVINKAKTDTAAAAAPARTSARPKDKRTPAARAAASSRAAAAVRGKGKAAARRPAGTTAKAGKGRP